MDYDGSTLVTWAMLNDFADHFPGQLVYINLPAWFWPLVAVGVASLAVLAVCMLWRTARGR